MVLNKKVQIIPLSRQKGGKGKPGIGTCVEYSIKPPFVRILSVIDGKKKYIAIHPGAEIRIIKEN